MNVFLEAWHDAQNSPGCGGTGLLTTEPKFAHSPHQGCPWCDFHTDWAWGVSILAMAEKPEGIECSITPVIDYYWLGCPAYPGDDYRKDGTSKGTGSSTTRTMIAGICSILPRHLQRSVDSTESRVRSSKLRRCLPTNSTGNAAYLGTMERGGSGPRCHPPRRQTSRDLGLVRPSPSEWRPAITTTIRRSTPLAGIRVHALLQNRATGKDTC